MDRRYHLSHAMNIASEAATLPEQCRAISVLQSHLMDMHSKHAPMSDGYSIGEVERHLLHLVQSQHYSDELCNIINDASRRSISYHRMSPGFLSDVKNWAVLTDNERKKTINGFIRYIAHVFRDIEHLPPSMIPETYIIKDNNEVAFIDKDHEPGSYIPTVRRKNFGIEFGDSILINRHHTTNYNNPYKTLAGVYGEYVGLVLEQMRDMRPTFFYHSHDKFRDDVALWNTAWNEGAFVDPYLDYIHSVQFHMSVINGQKSYMHDTLIDVMKEEWDSIPVREKTQQPLKQKIAGMLENVLRL